MFAYINLCTYIFVCMLSHSVVYVLLWHHGLLAARLLSLWNSPGKNGGLGCHFLLQGIFPTQVSNPHLLHCLLLLLGKPFGKPTHIFGNLQMRNYRMTFWRVKISFYLKKSTEAQENEASEPLHNTSNSVLRLWLQAKSVFKTNYFLNNAWLFCIELSYLHIIVVLLLVIILFTSEFLYPVLRVKTLSFYFLYNV